MKAELPESMFGAEALKIHYVSGTASETSSVKEIEEQFRARLTQSRNMDIRVGFTTAGPHRDDLNIYLNGRSLARFGSAGQQRSSLLSLYFAQMEIHRKTRGFHPIFLVDDVEAELDDLRLKTFVDYLSERTQTFLTTAKESLLPEISGDIRRFEVDAGRVAER
jgi:DNA replication and repair protein RecF